MLFDWEQYLRNYKDLRNANILTKEKAIIHWERFGKGENRTDKCIQKRYTLKLVKVPPNKLNIKNLKTSKTAPLVDLRNKLPPCYDQGNLGSCTANAIVAAYQFLTPSFMGSRLFQYYNERFIENSIFQDSGATIFDSIKAVINYGICPETEWPYNINQFAVKPSTNCYTDGLKHKATKVFNVQQTINSMKSYLSTGFPFIVGISVYASFESQSVAKTGIVPIPGPKDFLLGGHAVLVCGYNDNLINGMWIVRNSWGSSWGDKGYFYLPYNYLTNPNLCSELWCIESDTN